MIHQLIHRKGDEINEHNFDHRSESGKSSADREAHNGAFAYWRIHDAVRAKGLRKPSRNTEWPAQRNIFAEEVNRAIAAHLFMQSGTDRFQIGLFRHF